MAIRFHLDEHVSPIVANALRQHGFDVTTSQEQRLLGEADEDQLVFATKQGRALVTCDDGFTRHELVEAAVFGICYCHIDKYSVREFSQALLMVAECMHEHEMHRHLQYL